MKNKIYKILLLALLLLVPTTTVEALDTSKTGSINITYQYDDKAFDNYNIYLYKVATMNEEGIFAYEDNFKGNREINNLTSSEWSLLTTSLNKFIEENQISHYKIETTTSEGKANFTGLPAGLYLITVEDVKEKEYQYQSLPMLISVPNFDEIVNDYIYDINIITKTEKKKIESETPPVEDEKPPTDNNKNTESPIRIPYTFDAIIVYIIVFSVSVIGIILVGYYILKQKKGKRNEK